MTVTEITDISQIDFMNLDEFTNDIPHHWFTWLRNNAPVTKFAEPNGPGYWVITKYDDVVAVSRNSRTFSSDQRKGGVVGLVEVEADPANPFANSGDDAPQLMLTMDPPDHTRYRKLVNKGFTPRMINAMEEKVRLAAKRIIAEGVEKGEVDWVVDVAAELPLQVIADLIGVPQERRHDLFHWSNQMISGGEDPEYSFSQEEVGSAYIGMFGLAQQLADERRKNPEADIITTLLNSEVDGHTLSDMDFNMFFLLLAVAGNETTRNALAHGMNAFLEHPDQYQMLVEDPELVSSATEEVLRWASPVMYFRRNVTEDVEIRGQQIKAGDKVSIWYASANRDEEKFEDPFRFDITRNPNDHIAFGGGGAHFCLGASLARQEIRLLFEELVQQAPKIEQLGAPDRLRSNFIGGIKHLPVRLGR
jgi:cholest-4-en-3-one 26-monooxygenase